MTECVTKKRLRKIKVWKTIGKKGKTTLEPLSQQATLKINEMKWGKKKMLKVLKGRRKKQKTYRYSLLEVYGQVYDLRILGRISWSYLNGSVNFLPMDLAVSHSLVPNDGIGFWTNNGREDKKNHSIMITCVFLLFVFFSPKGQIN